MAVITAPTLSGNNDNILVMATVTRQIQTATITTDTYNDNSNKTN